MQKIFKKVLRTEPMQTVVVPEGADLLTVSSPEDGNIYLWYVADDELAPDTRVIALACESGVLPMGNHTYIGSAVSVLPYMWHVFDVTP